MIFIRAAVHARRGRGGGGERHAVADHGLPYRLSRLRDPSDPHRNPARRVRCSFPLFTRFFPPL
jgi:hypothetical protein